jgi:hypothetical protein
MTRVFAVKSFRRWQRKERISDGALCDAVARAEDGIIDADLGGGLIKQRVARPGQGRSGGYRTLIGYREQTRAVFLFGFAKNEQDNITAEELDTWKIIGRDLLKAVPAGIDDMMAKGALTELDCGQIN